MSTDDHVEVSVWAYTGTEWATVAGVAYTRVEFEVRHHDVGVWKMTLPHGHQSEALAPGRLVTTRFRDDLQTWTLNPRRIRRDDEGLVREVEGFSALEMLARATAWPTPAAPITEQGAQGSYSGPAETVIRSLVVENLRDRYGLDMTATPSQGRGATVRSKPRFVNLRDEVLRVAQRGGLGVWFGLVPAGSDTRAELRLRFYEPRDRTVRVTLSAADGSLAGWELIESGPTLTRAIVGGSGTGAGQYLRVVSTAAAESAARKWGGHIEGYVDGPETFDNTTLDDAGRDAIAEGAATTTLSMEADEPAGTKAFKAFRPGDTVMAEPYPGTRIPDVITAVKVTHERGIPEVTPMFGDPDRDDPDASAATLIRALRRDVAALKINRKRGTT